MKRWLIVFVFIIIATVLPAKVLDPNAPAGSRKNPVPVRTTISTIVTENGRKIANTDLAINGVMRGQLANIFIFAMFISEGVDLPSIDDDSKEYMIVVLSVDNTKDLTGNDEAFYVGHEQVMLANKTYVSKVPERIAHLPDEIDGNMYEGSSHAGYLLYKVNVDEEYYLVYQNIWFDLGTSSDEETINSLLN